MPDRDEPIAPTLDGFELPVTEVLTGRGAVFGKSGSGKSNTVTVVLEELLDRDLGFLVVDSDGEYYGLKESYEVVRAGNDEHCDVQVGPDDAESLARLALEEEVPVVLDLSGYLDTAVVDQLVEATLKHLFHLENDRQQPFLVVLEEAHEYVPQSGQTDGLSETVIRVAKRGRKRGLGMLAVSQRPAAVDKDFITQCNWLVWHRLTWNNDIDVVRKHLDGPYADRIESLDAGEAFVVGDWEDGVEEVQFRKKRTFDAGATPGFESVNPPNFQSITPGVLRGIGSRRDGPTTAAGTGRTQSTIGDPSAKSDATGSDGDGGTNGSDGASSTSGTSESTPTRSHDSRAPPSGPPRGDGRGRDHIVLETGHLLTYLIRSGAKRLRRGLASGAEATWGHTRLLGSAMGSRIEGDGDGRLSVTAEQAALLVVLVVLLLILGIVFV